MAVSGTINVNLSALDTYTTDGVESEKKVVLSSSASLPSAVVAVASGTCGTTAVNVDFSEFRGADGELVSYGKYDESTKIVFSATPSAQLEWIVESQNVLRMTSRNGGVVLSDLPLGELPRFSDPIQVKTVTIIPAGYTASYTVMLIKEA